MFGWLEWRRKYLTDHAWLALGVATLGLGVSDPPTQAEVQSIADKLDELINALRR